MHIIINSVGGGGMAPVRKQAFHVVEKLKRARKCAQGSQKVPPEKRLMGCGGYVSLHGQTGRTPGGQVHRQRSLHLQQQVSGSTGSGKGEILILLHYCYEN